MQNRVSIFVNPNNSHFEQILIDCDRPFMDRGPMFETDTFTYYSNHERRMVSKVGVAKT